MKEAGLANWSAGDKKPILKRINPYSIKSSIIVSFMLLISITVLSVSLISYRYTINDFENLSIDYTVRMLREINASIDSYIGNMKNMAQVVVENNDVRRLMSFYIEHNGRRLSYLEEQELKNLTENAVTHLATVAGTRGDITNVAIISKYKDVVLSDKNKTINENSRFNISDWFLKPLSYKDEMVVSPSHVQKLIEGEYRWVISISKAITDIETGNVTGVLVIDLNYRTIEGIFENAQLGKNGYIYLVDRHKNIIYHPQQQLIYSGAKAEPVDDILKMKSEFMRAQNGSRIYMRNDSPITGWSAVGVVNTDELIKNKPTIVNFYITLVLASILSALVIAVIISNTITKPLRELESTMHKVEGGDLSVKSEIDLNNEIGHLSNTFNVMIGRIKLLMENLVKNEEEKRRSEILALQAQINPHFLYNTLDSIIWMSAGGESEKVVEITSALAQLFRTSISKGDSLVTLHNEIDNINSYLTIQKMRYGDKLSYSITIPEELKSITIPKLILQPIVENAIYHGIKPCPNGGTIGIAAEKEGGTLVLSVSDNGVGMSGEQLKALFKEKDGSESGIGVINVENRIRLLFGEQYGLSYISREKSGTTAYIRLPAVGGEERHV